MTALDWLHLLLFQLSVSLLAVGGAVTLAPDLHRYIVQGQGWLTESQFGNAITLAQVAPGIAEALIATAMGLFAAIPAVIAYNRYTHDIDHLSNRMETFMEEFSNILQRQATKPAS